MYSLILFLPLAGACIAGFCSSFLGVRAVSIISCILVSLAAVLSLIVFFPLAQEQEEVIFLASWINVTGFRVDWSIRVDRLTHIMLVVVNGVSALVHIYSLGYMAKDPHQPRFFAYLSLFTFAMLALVMSDNLVQMFFGWEGVGLASYLLIGFWHQRESANQAAIKAFIVNRIGDFGFMVAILAIFLIFDSLDFDVIFDTAGDYRDLVIEIWGQQIHVLTAIGVLLFIGAMGKSAQFFLHVWLADAMEGPTPVSALIHAATMVTAGVFLICRMAPIYAYAPDASAFILLVGTITALFAASVGLVQNDIKRVVAYSTCSQLGYMFIAAGAGAYSVAMFHLFTHAAFKALLFLGAGAVIHGLHEQQDMRKMGGLRSKMPHSFWLMVIGATALSGLGIPLLNIGLSGFYSKDSIIETTFASEIDFALLGFGIAVLVAGLTSFYAWRLIWMTFFGAFKGEDKNHFNTAHEAPLTMLAPLYILGIFSVCLGYLFYNSFVGHGGYWEAFWGTTRIGDHNLIEHGHEAPLAVKIAPFIASLCGFGLSWYFYIRRPDLPARLARQYAFLYQFLLNKWYFDEIYAFCITRQTHRLGNFLWRSGDIYCIDGYGPNAICAHVLRLMRQVVRMQSGYIYHYAFVMLIGLVTFLSLFLYRGG